MELFIRRIILFTAHMAEMTAFYHDVLGLQQIADEVGWKEFRAGGCNIALHSGASVVGSRAPKVVFYSNDVEEAREALSGRGARLGKLRSGDDLCLCEGKDPDGNPFQISNRA